MPRASIGRYGQSGPRWRYLSRVPAVAFRQVLKLKPANARPLARALKVAMPTENESLVDRSELGIDPPKIRHDAFRLFGRIHSVKKGRGPKPPAQSGK